MKSTEINLSEYMILPRDALYVGQALNFSIYMLMEKNQTFVLYHKLGEVLGAEQMQKILQIPEKSLRVPKKEYVAFLESQKNRVKELGKTGELKEEAVKSVGKTVINSFDMHQTNAAPAEGRAKKAEDILNDMTKIVSEIILQFKDKPSVQAYEKILHGAEIAKDPIFTHNYHVSGLAVLIMMSLGCTKIDELTDMGIAGLLHDIGMSGIPQSFMDHHLAGESPQDEEAKATYMKHIDIALKMLETKGRNVSANAKKIIESHHENMDGTGFKGLAGDQIFLLARVLRIADDLCTNLTGNKGPRSIRDILKIMREKPAYDKTVIDALLPRATA